MTVQENVEYGLKVKACRRRPSAAAGPARCSTSSASASFGDRRPEPAVAAASVSGSRWPGRSSTTPGCCCSTSRSARSTSSCARRCRSSSKTIQREVGITFVFVTHDQGEALSMSTRVAVFNNGRIEQVGTPRRSTTARRRRSSPASSGPSNLLDADAVAALLGGAGHSVRPGADPGPRRDSDAVGRPTMSSCRGMVVDVLYLGGRRAGCASPSTRSARLLAACPATSSPSVQPATVRRSGRRGRHGDAASSPVASGSDRRAGRRSSGSHDHNTTTRGMTHEERAG